MHQANRQHIYGLVANAFCAHCWQLSVKPDATCLAKVDYDTAVGKKEAHIVDFWPSDDELLTLTGVYQSEGRNVLSNVFATLPLWATPEQVEQQVKAFVQDVNAAVDASYARRLLLNR